jgi:hypothetical protein
MAVSIYEFGFPALYVLVTKANVVNPEGIYTEQAVDHPVPPNTIFVNSVPIFLAEKNSNLSAAENPVISNPTAGVIFKAANPIKK